MQEINKNNKAEVIKIFKELPVDKNQIILGGAEWCESCLEMKKDLESLEDKFPEVTFIYVDVDALELDELPIKSIPFVVLISKDMKKVTQTVGSLNLDKLTELLTKME